MLGVSTGHFPYNAPGVLTFFKTRGREGEYIGYLFEVKFRETEEIEFQRILMKKLNKVDLDNSF